LNKFDGFAHGFALFLGKNFDGQIRTPEFAEPAADTVLGPSRNRLFPVIQLQNIFGTEFHADPASLAPVPVNDMLFQFGFSHSSFLYREKTINHEIHEIHEMALIIVSARSSLDFHSGAIYKQSILMIFIDEVNKKQAPDG
jgi:hypothetical protein